MSKNPRNSNPLVSYGVLVSMIVLGLLPFLMMSAAYGTINTERWSAYNASSILMISIIIIVFGILFYYVREHSIDVEVFARLVIDVDELQNKKYLDYLFAHYGNVASVAAFFAALTFAVKTNLPNIGITASSLILSLLLPVLIMLYGLVFAKSVFGALRRHAIIWVSLLIMLLLDITLITMAINSVPQI